MSDHSHVFPEPAALELSEQLVVLGRAHDVAGTFPRDCLIAVAEAGLHRRFAPVSAGGAHFETQEDRYAAMLTALRQVGRGDLSVGRLYEGHVNAMLLFGWYASDAQRAWLAERLDRGAWFGVWATEPTPGVCLSDGVLSGAKAFASGAGGIDYALVTIAAAGGDRRLAIVPADDAARADVSGWRVRGMRASVSGRYELTGLAIDQAMLLGAPGDYDREPRFTAGAWRFCAVQLGGTEALLAAIQTALRGDARSDPVQVARFAGAVVATRSAGFWVREAALHAARETADAPAIVQMTRGVVERSALDVMEAAARLLGTRSAFDGDRADRIIRDLSLYLRQGGPDYARHQAGLAFLDADRWAIEDRLW